MDALAPVFSVPVVSLNGGLAPQHNFAVVKRSVIVSGQKTSVSLEDAFWSGLKDIAASRGISLSRLLAAIEADRSTQNLSSAIRLYVLAHFRARASFPVLIGERRIVDAAAGAYLIPERRSQHQRRFWPRR